MKRNKKAKLSDIAKELGVSNATVSRALNGSEKVQPATKSKILALAKKLNYKPNQLAQGLVKKSTKTIGVILPTFEKNFFFRVLKGIESVLHSADYKIIITTSGDNAKQEKEACYSLSSYHVDGIILSLSYNHEDPNFLIDIQDDGIPLLFMDRIYEEIDANYVISDDFTGMYEAINKLIDKGRRRIVHIKGPENISTSFSRHQGYKQALKDHGIEYDKELVVQCEHEAEVKQSLRSLFKQGIDFDAVTCYNDYYAFHAMELLKERGIEVPKDVGIVGFANEPLASYTSPKLSTVNQPAELMGKRAASLIINEIDLLKKEEAYEFETVLMETYLIERETTL
ncbi:LacI family transcriptional regulator [Flammeovirga pectinis]|uniref:LacI family transcriptional regulator n=1 Tax=Flammeovirga pectinis TaxID=2494373 RepID=A0A3S9PA57_9BACT|nr:LacI family DNA-binding transcriptional regulator [Flammeovirga pectinis]AZQ64962.1 LacI family transcriptional regulator [Flammeovirga pectinis]